MKTSQTACQWIRDYATILNQPGKIWWLSSKNFSRVSLETPPARAMQQMLLQVIIFSSFFYSLISMKFSCPRYSIVTTYNYHLTENMWSSLQIATSFKRPRWEAIINKWQSRLRSQSVQLKSFSNSIWDQVRTPQACFFYYICPFTWIVCLS